jgi:hypothetical protein
MSHPGSGRLRCPSDTRHIPARLMNFDHALAEHIHLGPDAEAG